MKSLPVYKRFFFDKLYQYESICVNFWITLFVCNDPKSSVPFKGAKTSQNPERDRGSDPDNLYESNVLVSSDRGNVLRYL